MAAFNLSLTLGATTRSRNGTASGADLLRFVAALRLRYPAAADDNAAVDLFLLDVVAWGKQITRDQERSAANTQHVESIAEIAVT